MKNFILLKKNPFIFILFAMVFVSGCNIEAKATVSLSSISVTETPDKLIYKQGEVLDLTGLEVAANYSDGSTQVLKSNEYTTDPSGSSVLNVIGKQKIQISYKDQTASFTITVEEKEPDAPTIIGIYVSKNASKLFYFIGDELDLSGLEITAQYSDGSEHIVTGWATEPSDGLKLTCTGEKDVTVTYGDYSVSFTIEVMSACNSYFWGIWVRMDNGTQYEILEDRVIVDDFENGIISSSDTTLVVSSIGTFKKESENVMINDNIPYFRNGGANLGYSLKLVGFTDNISRAAGASVSGIKGKARSDKYTSFESDSESNDEGLIEFTAPAAGDTQTVEIENGDDLIVIPGLKILNDGDYMGTVPIVGKDDYSLKITGVIDDSEKDDGYLYGNYYKNYPLTLNITNISDKSSSPLLCIIEPEDSNLNITSNYDISGIPISTLKSGLTKTITLNVEYGSIFKSYIDTGINITIKDSGSDREWKDYIPLRFYKGLMPVTIAAKSTEDNAEAALNGFIIYPDGNNQFFTVPDKEKKVVYVPTFGTNKNYIMAFSGATVNGELSESTEMFYTVSICSSTAKNVEVSGMNSYYAMQFGENNNSEDNAYLISDEFESYIADGDIDFFKFEAESSVILLPNELDICQIDYDTEFGTKPSSVRLASGTILTEDLLPVLSKDGYYFAGWYDDTDMVSPGSEIKNNMRLTARWNKYRTFSFKTDRGEIPESLTFYDTQTITSEDLPKIEKQGKYKCVGWYVLDSREVISSIVVSEDLELTAKWVLSECEITYFSEYGTVPEIKDCSYNTKISSEDLPQLLEDGYTFLGWYCGEELIDENYVVETDIVLTAKWQINIYKITYYSDYALVPDEKSYDFGTILQEEDLPVLEEYGYTFSGWFYTDDDGVSVAVAAGDRVLKNMNLTAKWIANTYKITFVSENGEVPESMDVNYNQMLFSTDIPVMSCEEYTFLGWYDGETKIQPGYIVNKNVVFTAKWKIKTLTISYITTFGDQLDEKNMTYGTEFSEDDLPTLAYEGYTFTGWYSGDLQIKVGDIVKEDLVLTAGWSVNTYRITYVTEHGLVPESIELDYKTIIAPSHLPKLAADGYNFLGWYIGEEKYTSGNVILSDITLTARWEKFVYHIGDIVLADGSRIGAEDQDSYVVDATNRPVAVIFSATDTVNRQPARGLSLYNSSSTMMWAPTTSEAYNTDYEYLKEDNTDGFNTWYYMDGNYTSLISSASTKLPALYTAHSYGTAKGLFGEMANYWYMPSLQEFRTIYENIDLIENALAVAGGTSFVDSEYWTNTQSSDSSERAVGFYGKTGEENNYLKSKYLTVRAARNFGELITVEYDSNGGSEVESQKVKYNSKLMETSYKPEKLGCSFKGWQYDGVDYDFSLPVIEGFTLIAHWEVANLPISVETYLVGDIVLKDGTVFRNIVDTLSEDQQEEAIAVIFKASSSSSSALGVGLHQESKIWCTSNANAYNKQWSLWNTILTNDPEGAVQAETYYPAFYWVNSYGSSYKITGEMGEDWYMPTVSVLESLYTNKSSVNDAMKYVDGDEIMTYDTWSSQSSSNYSYVYINGTRTCTYPYAYYKNTSNTTNSDYKSYSKRVVAIKSFGGNSKSYTITFDCNGGAGAATQTVDEGQTGTSPTPTYQGYTFDGWYLDGELYDFTAAVTQDLILTAKWTLKYSPIEVEEYKVRDIVLNDGKVFRNVDSSLSAEQQKSVVAVIFKEVDSTGPALGVGLMQSSKYWCTSSANYKNNYNSWEDVIKNDSTHASDAQTYYPAFYWANNYGELLSDSGNYGIGWWMPNYLQLSKLQTKISSVNSSITYAGGTTALTGYTWSSTSYYYSSSSLYSYAYSFNSSYNSYHYKTSNNLYVRAVHEFGDAYTVTFDTAGNQSISSQRIAKGYLASKPTDPSSSGCTFLGWYVDDTEYDFSTPVTSDITLVAKWEYTNAPIEVTSYQIGDAVTVDGTVFRNVDAAELPASQKADVVAIIIKNATDTEPALGIGLKQTTKSWVTSSSFGYYTDFEANKITYSDSTGACVYEGDEYPCDNWDYIQSLDEITSSIEGSYPAYEWINSYGKAFYPDSEDFTDGWFMPDLEQYEYLCNNYSDINTMLANYNGTKLAAAWYWSSAQAGDSSNNGIECYLSAFSISTESKSSEKYIRVLRYFGGKKVTFNSDGGTEIVAKILNNGSTVTEPPVPVKDGGYIFDGWYLDGVLYDFSDPVTNNITLVAKWESVVNTPITTDEYQVGDIVLNDGSILRNVYGTLTENQKNNAVAVIFKATGNGGDALGIGLKKSETSLIWAANGTTGYNTFFSEIKGSYTSTNDVYTFDGDIDGSNNWDYLSSVNAVGAANASSNYPAFNWINVCMNTSDGNYKDNWYMPSLYEAYLLQQNESTIRNNLWKAGNMTVYFDSIWTSTQSSSANSSYYINMKSHIVLSEKSSAYTVVPISKF